MQSSVFFQLIRGLFSDFFGRAIFAKKLMAKWTNLYIPYREVKLLLLFFAVFSLSPGLQNYDITKLVRKRPLEEVEIITAAKEKIR